ncbi:hypothetical protein CUJ84_Chr002828 [Rhizobium leguminosarum]|uniref:Uncharacterized protein n=1 Tax=Rhizobium leguminosarum TaxID=384 RepID=A0A2K9Z4K6_RHILE|nr:hypothetical protein CUJ84_Chr002828 [Rhizobium leguminosarum]
MSVRRGPEGALLLSVTFDLRLGQMKLAGFERFSFDPESYGSNVPPHEAWAIGIAAELKQENLIIIEVFLFPFPVPEHSVRQESVQFHPIVRIADREQFRFLFGDSGKIRKEGR